MGSLSVVLKKVSDVSVYILVCDFNLFISLILSNLYILKNVFCFMFDEILLYFPNRISNSIL